MHCFAKMYNDHFLLVLVVDRSLYPVELHRQGPIIPSSILAVGRIGLVSCVPPWSRSSLLPLYLVRPLYCVASTSVESTLNKGYKVFLRFGS
jgi:hypothetical protein